jgi:hypothetical protein
MKFEKILKNIQDRYKRNKDFKSYRCSPDIKLSRIYGYNSDCEVIETEAQVIRLINQLFQKGFSPEQLKKVIDSRGLKNRSHKKFTISELLAIGTKPIYCGYFLSPNNKLPIKSNHYSEIISVSEYLRALEQLKKMKINVKIPKFPS